MSDDNSSGERHSTTRQLMSEEEATQWLAESRAAIAEWNEFIEKHGLPLAKYRSF